MKIKYSISENLYKYYNESIEIAQKRKKIEKYGSAIIFDQIAKYSLYILLFGLYILIFFNIKINEILFYIMNSIFTFYIGIYLFYIIGYIIGYNSFKKQNNEGTLTIKESKIIDKDDKIKIEFNIDDISSIIIGQYSLNIFFTNTKIYIRIPVPNDDNLVDEIKKYKEDIKVIKLYN